MSDRAAECANCGNTLPAPDAVCSRCEHEFDPACPDAGKHRCPHCSKRFGEPLQSWFPPDVPWYRPQTQTPQCPHCKAFLYDRKALTLSPSETAAWVTLIVASNFSPWRPGTQILLLVVLGTWQLVRWKRIKLLVVEEERFVPAKRA